MSRLHRSTVARFSSVFSFSSFQAVECLVHQTAVSDAACMATGAPVVASSILSESINPTNKSLAPTLSEEIESPTPHGDPEEQFEYQDSYEGIFQVEFSESDLFELKEVNDSIPSGYPNVKGRLSVHIEFWERIEALAFIIDTIRGSYKISFFKTPTPLLNTTGLSQTPSKNY